MINEAIGKDLKSEFEEKLAVGSVIYLLTSVPGEAITLTTTEFNPNYLQIIPYEDTEWLTAEPADETTLNIIMDAPQGRPNMLRSTSTKEPITHRASSTAFRFRKMP